jgi:NitT/TauT family transport system substrate-binding protein
MRKCGIAALTVGVVCLGFTTARAEPTKIRIAWSVAPAQLAPILLDPPGVAHNHGKSYTLETVRHAGSALTLTALAAGELDIAPMTFNVFAPAVLNAQMTDIRIIADEFRDGAEGYTTNQYMVLKDGPIAKIEDLKGKVLAMNGIGGGQDIFMRVMLRKHGLEYPRDFTIIESNFPAMRAMLAEKKADLVVGVKPFTEDPRFKAVARPLFTQKEAVGPSDMLFLTARTAFLQKNRAAVVDFFEDYVRAIRWYTDPANHKEAVAIVSKFTKAPPEQLGWIFTKEDFYRDPNGRPDVAQIQQSINMLKEFGFIKADLDVKKYTDLSLLDEAAKRVK